MRQQLELRFATKNRGVIGKPRCKDCGEEESRRRPLHCTRGRCVIACGVLVARKELGKTCHGCGDTEKDPLLFERPELPGHPFCWPCAEHGAAFWDWHIRMWELQDPDAKYPFDPKHEARGRHRAWPFTRLSTNAAARGAREG